MSNGLKVAGLSESARGTLMREKIDPVAFVQFFGAHPEERADGSLRLRWGGDECGCHDDRCVGHHHDAWEACGCLPAMIGRYRESVFREPLLDPWVWRISTKDFYNEFNGALARLGIDDELEALFSRLAHATYDAFDLVIAQVATEAEQQRLTELRTIVAASPIKDGEALGEEWNAAFDEWGSALTGLEARALAFEGSSPAIAAWREATAEAAAVHERWGQLEDSLRADAKRMMLDQGFLVADGDWRKEYEDAEYAYAGSKVASTTGQDFWHHWGGFDWSRVGACIEAGIRFSFPLFMVVGPLAVLKRFSCLSMSLPEQIALSKAAFGE